jgi:ABC-type branched-subunit amino acid transport system substrate-binding protein
MLAVAAAVVVAAAGCGSSKSSSSGGGGGKTITIGVLTDATGLAASGNKTSVQGVEAGIVVAKAAGYNIKYVVGDDTTSPSGALSAAQKLVQQDHVLAVIAVSAVAFGATNYLTSQGVPVLGVAEDGPEWVTSKNMFSTFGFLDPSKVGTAAGQLFKQLGATNVGLVGYSISPSSAEAAKGDAISAQQAGLKVGYLNANFPFGSTNVAPVALQMKNNGVDGFTAAVDPNTGLALLSALRQLGDNPKVALFPTGYGADLAQGGPAAVQEAQGAYFSLSFEPIEMNTAATHQFANALKQIGINGDPTYAEYGGYTGVALLVQGLKAAGSNPTHASLINALSGITDFTADGLLGSHSLSMADRAASEIGVDGCTYITKLSGSSFQLVPNADPICGTLIPGKTVSASS